MARGSIVTRTLGAVVHRDDGRHAVVIRGKNPRVFTHEEDAGDYLSKNGEKRYDCVLRIHGKQKWKTFERKKDAEEYLDRHSTDLRDGTFRAIKKSTFGEYCTHWRATYLLPRTYKPSTLHGYLSIIETHILPEFEHYGMQAISPAEINSFKSKLLQKTAGTMTKPGKEQKRMLSNKTARNVLMLLGKIFDDAVKDARLRYSPMQAIEKPKVSNEKKGRALKPAEIQALLLNAEDDDTRLIIKTAILTGMRRAELFGLRWEDVDLKHDILRVRQTLYWRHGRYVKQTEGGEPFMFVEPKSKTSIREIDLSPALKTELKRLLDQKSTVAVSSSGKVSVKEPLGLVFCQENGRPRNPNDFLKRPFARAVKAAQLGKLRVHDLRHTFGALKIEQNENIYYIQRQMGHSSIQVTIDIYGHLLETRKPEAAAKTDDFLFGKAAVAPK